VSVGTSANLGFCAEVCAIADMIKNGETQIELIVAAGPEGKIITPCGRCRELMFQINRKNEHAKIMLSDDETISLQKLLPHPWQDYWPE
jgi:cytidine deaminase